MQQRWVTNGEAVLQALKSLESASTKNLFHAADVMWQVRRDGWQISTDKTRNILKFLAGKGSVEMVRDGRRYYFRTAQR